MHANVNNNQIISFGGGSKAKSISAGNPLDTKFYSPGQTATRNRGHSRGSPRRHESHGRGKGHKRSLIEQVEALAPRGILGAMFGAGGNKTFGADTNSYQQDSVDNSNHRVNAKANNNQVLAFRRDHSDGDDGDHLSARGVFGRLGGMLGMGGGHMNIGGDNNYHQHESYDYSNHRVHANVHNNQIFGFRRDHSDGDDGQHLSARGIFDSLSGMLGNMGMPSMNFGGDSNSHEHNSVDQPDRSVQKNVHSNQVLGFRSLADGEDEDEQLQKRSSGDALAILQAMKSDFFPFSDDDLKDLQDLQDLSNGNGNNDDVHGVHNNVIINDSYESHTDTSNNKGIIINGKKVDLGNGAAAQAFHSWVFKREPSPQDYNRAPGSDRAFRKQRAAQFAKAKPAASSRTKVYDASAHNTASFNGNQGVINNSGNLIEKEESCSVLIDARDFQAGALIPRGHGGHHRESSKSSCRCQCSKRSLPDGDDDKAVSELNSRAESEIHNGVKTVVHLEKSCSIFQDDETKHYQWRGQCAGSTVDGRPVTEMFPEAL